jgi:hypothetical protein
LTYSVLALLTVYGFVRSVVAAAGKPFWYDELLTEVRFHGAEQARFFESAGYRELPVVVPNGSTLLATVYYAFPDRAQRFAYLRSANDPDQSDTTDKGLQQVSKYWPIQVETAQSFLAEHARFLVYTEGPDVGKDRVTSTALRAGWSVRVVAFDGFRALYLVSREREN